MSGFLDHLIRRARKLKRETGNGILIVGVEADPGGPGCPVVFEGLSGADIELAALSLLEVFERELIENARDCAWCADRLDRVTAAAAALRAGVTFPAATPPQGRC